MKSIQMSIPVKLTILLAFVFLIITYVSVEIRYSDLAEERDSLNERIEAVGDSCERLQNKLDTPFDEEYIIDLAKDKLNYCLPDEIVFYNDLID